MTKLKFFSSHRETLILISLKCSCINLSLKRYSWEVTYSVPLKARYTGWLPRGSVIWRERVEGRTIFCPAGSQGHNGLNQRSQGGRGVSAAGHPLPSTAGYTCLLLDLYTVARMHQARALPGPYHGFVVLSFQDSLQGAFQGEICCGRCPVRG